jgi:hypothetical protein
VPQSARDVANTADAERARERRKRAACQYRPKPIKTLLVGQAPPPVKPGEAERYFYFEEVASKDYLFVGVAKAVFGRDPGRHEKPELLAELRRRGFFLMDVKLDPVDVGPPFEYCIEGAIRRARDLKPQRMILIKVDVYDEAFHRMRDAGLPVIDKRISFPSYGNQRDFDEQFKDVLRMKPAPRTRSGRADRLTR